MAYQPISRLITILCAVGLSLSITEPPETPTNLGFSDVTYNSVTLRWTSEFDIGSGQSFQVYRLWKYHSEKIATVYDTSTNQSVRQNMTYVLTGLESATFYNITVGAINTNTNQTSGFAHPSVSFVTQSEPNPDDNTGAYVLGGILGGLGVLAVLALIVYLVGYRNMRTKYVRNEDTKTT